MAPTIDKKSRRPRLTPLEQRLHDLVEPIVTATGYELVRVRIAGKEGLTVQIMAERPDKSMRAEDCAIVSRALSAMLEDEDPIEGAYRLEVSSPGIDRPLVRLKDYHDWQGYEARLELTEPMEGQKRFKGVLAGVEGEAVCFDIENETETALIPFSLILGGKLVLTDALIRESLRAAKANRPADDTPNAGDNPDADDSEEEFGDDDWDDNEGIREGSGEETEDENHDDGASHEYGTRKTRP